MNKFLWVSSVLMALFVTGESLTCNTCELGIGGECLVKTTEICDVTRPNCFWGELSFNVSNLMKLETRGCLDTIHCNKTETGTLLTAGYTITKKCCSTDLCNGVKPLEFPTLADLSAALMSIWKPWGH